MKKILLAWMLFATPLCLLAGGTNGGTPPAREQLEELLMSVEISSAGLFDNEAGDFGLLTNRELQPRMTFSVSQMPTAGINISENDFRLLRKRKQPIDATGVSEQNKSYQIVDGDRFDTLILIDRRASARASVLQ